MVVTVDLAVAVVLVGTPRQLAEPMARVVAAVVTTMTVPSLSLLVVQVS